MYFSQFLPWMGERYAGTTHHRGAIRGSLPVSERGGNGSARRSKVYAYTLWEHVYRPAIRRDCGLQQVDSDAFGDLRHYRNAILHNKDILENDTKALTVFGKGDATEPTNDELHDIFKQLVLALNDVELRYYGEDLGFEWERRLNA